MLLCTALILINTLSAGIQASAIETATDIMVMNENQSDEGINDAVDVMEKGKTLDNVTNAIEDDVTMDDTTEEKDDIVNEIENSQEVNEIKENAENLEAMGKEKLIAEAEIATVSDVSSGTCGENLTWEFAGDTLTISGNGSMDDYYVGQYPSWHAFKNSLASVKISDGVAGIGNLAFYNCTSLTNIEIPATVTGIGDSAFLRCTGLTDVYYDGSESDWNSISISLLVTTMTALLLPPSTTIAV